MTGRDAREAALEVLTACRRAEAWADGGVKRAVRGMDPRDAALTARLVYGVLQNRALLDFYITACCTQRADKLEPVIRDILRIGAYQLLFLDKIPASAAVDRAVEMAKVHRRPRAAGMVNAVLRNMDRSRAALPQPKDLPTRYSHPKWLVDRLTGLLGRQEVEAFLAANNSQPPTAVQVATLRSDGAALRASLEGQGVTVEAHPWLEGCFLLSGTGDLEGLEAFQAGAFYVQDPAGRLAVAAAEIRPGMDVLDLCAAPGGKSFAAAMAMEDRGRILARDIYPHKLSLLQAGADRLGITCLETALGDARDCAGLGQFDRVLCDVPCSGLGVIRKKPDIRYKRPEELKDLPAVQLAILQAAADRVRPGGVLLYTTCTVLPEENEDVTGAFLEGREDFVREAFTLPDPAGACPGQIVLWPQRHGTDGFYICKLRRQA